MSRLHSEDKKKIRLYSERADGYQISEKNKEIAAIRRIAKEASVENKIERAGRASFNSILYAAEKEWKLACKKHDVDKIEETRRNFLRALDNAAANSIARIIAEIKQNKLMSNKIFKNTFIDIDLPVADFYADFENYCKKELKNYTISENDFKKIIERYLNLNLATLKSYGENFGYLKPAEQFEKNLKYIKNFLIKEHEISL